MPIQASTGQCNLCGSTLSKSGMTRHLQACLRRASVEKSPQERSKKKARAFHIVTEGRYEPDYWMHLMIPATATLEDLDMFLRQTWLECCGHLSAFSIEGKSYSSSAHQEGGMYFDPDEEAEEELTEEEIQEILSNPDTPAPLKQMLQMSDEEVEENPDKALEVVRDALIEILGAAAAESEEISRAGDSENGNSGKIISLDAYRSAPAPGVLMEALNQISQAAPEDVMRLLEQVGPPSQFIDAQEECMHFELGDVLEKGTGFHHEYDYGTTTELNLRVVSEGEAELPGRSSPIQVLARNDPPETLCQECGKPAVVVCSMCLWEGKGWLCKRCSRKHDCQGYGPDEEMMLPVVNSPRVGKCGYDGE
jgi:hypothetical protein